MNKSRWGPFVLLVFLLAACATPTPIGPVEAQMTSMAAQVQACATLQSLGTPYPCNPPTATPTPPPTATPPPTPTEIPFTGWMHYPEGGGPEKMPYGWEPDCGGVVGCPGNAYRYFINGVPQGPDPDTYKGTPGYWPWVLGGIPAFIAICVLMYVSAYGMAAPQRAAAKVMLLMGQAYADAARAGSAMLPPPQDPEKIQARRLIFMLEKFNQANPVPWEYLVCLGQMLGSRFKQNDRIPLVVALQMLKACDRKYGVNITQSFGEFLTEQLSIRR